jgi:hypothetical protein
VLVIVQGTCTGSWHTAMLLLVIIACTYQCALALVMDADSQQLMQPVNYVPYAHLLEIHFQELSSVTGAGSAVFLRYRCMHGVGLNSTAF